MQFLPAKKVKEKAKKLRKNTGSDTLFGSKNILPTTCRQVVMDQLWSFSLTILTPGSERNMDDLTAAREVSFYCSCLPCQSGHLLVWYRHYLIMMAKSCTAMCCLTSSISLDLTGMDKMVL